MTVDGYDRKRLPIVGAARQPDPAFDVRDQDPPFVAELPVAAPDQAPNVLVILIDDMGFGASSAFGGPCRMPAAEALAANGLTYTRFHTTAVCAPTRASLLSGRNHHRAGMGWLPERATAAPGYTARRPDDVATVAQILQANGYATGAFGKMHQTPATDVTPVGPFDRWPTGDGFQKFYGFLGGETNQFSPHLYDGITPVDPPVHSDKPYHLSEDLVDQALHWTDSIRSIDPQRPWFTYLSFGACHAPFQVPEAWRQRYAGEFAHGWDEQRDRTLRQQKARGIVPHEARLSDWPDSVPRWSDLTENQRVVAARLMEVYAAFAEHTDAQVGRLTEALAARGELDNTLIFYILGDNGAAASGGIDGTLSETVPHNGLADDADRMMPFIDAIGGPDTYPLYPVGWALAMDTPYPWVKMAASHFGGTRTGMITHWPAGFGSRGQVRHQWHHVIDVTPTILDAAGIPQPEVVNGVQQEPMHGVSMRYSFDDAQADERHTTQYFEILGNRALYDHGWMASALHAVGWATSPRVSDVLAHEDPWLKPPRDRGRFSDDTWELYDTAIDWSQADDIAHKFPDKLAELQDKFMDEARKYRVLPLDDRVKERANPRLAGRRDVMGGRSVVTLPGSMPRLKENVAPNVKNRSFTVLVAVEPLDRRMNGVLVSQGGRFGGWSLYMVEGRLVYCHNVCSIERHYVRAGEPIERGAEISFSFTADGKQPGTGGYGELRVDGQVVGSARIPRTTPNSFSSDETLDIGMDRGTPVTEEYAAYPDNGYEGQLHSVTFVLDEGYEMTPAQALATALVAH